MKQSVYRRLWALALTLSLLLGMVPVFFAQEAKAVSGIDALTCSGFISNATAQNYIDVMMHYYLNNNSKLRTTLDNGLSVVFMFEGGSDYYWSGNAYNNSAYDVRDQAVVIVVQKNSSGNAYIDFYSENCSSIPGDPSWCTGAAYSGSTTILDGIYPFYTTNHTGPYAALQLDMSAANGYGYYTPSSDLDGFKNGASGINVHTRASDIAAGSDLGWAWSEGCQVIGSGSTSSNVFNGFMQSVTGISWYPWVDYYASPKDLNTFAYTGTHMGYYVVDRQLGLMNSSGTQYGSGSLTALYTETALTNITAYSTSARANADFNTNYLDRCTLYRSHGQLKSKYNASINSLPCAADTNGSVKLETSAVGDLYTVTGLYNNHAGNYWYEVITKSGETGYIYNTSAIYQSTYTSDISLSGASAPNGHVKGNVFSLTGTISAKRLEITDASVWVHSGFGSSGTQVTGGTATINGNSYNLYGSTIDSNTLFDELATGKYTYIISVAYKSYFVSEDGKLMYAYGTKTLLSEYFTVISSSVSQSSCSHSYVTTTLTSPTCTQAGSGVRSCSTCGLVSDVTISATGHSYGSWTTVDATCAENGSKSRTCGTCNYVQTLTLDALGHDYVLSVREATCLEKTRFVYTCNICNDSYLLDLQPYHSQWLETIPQELDASLFATRIQYRYCDLGDNGWGNWSDWSSSVYTPSPTRQVEQRTLYRLKAMPLGDHSWAEGICTVCSKTCTHSYVDHYCTICGYREPDNDLYLFGFINGANYACEEDAANTGAYKFEDGQLVVTFTQRSYVAVKTGDNRIWYMTDGYPGDNATTATLYSTSITADRSDKVSVPRGREITFRVVRNDDGTLTLSYVAADCEHIWTDSICSNCDQMCEHLRWTHGTCGSCGLACEHKSWTNGVCDNCALNCKHTYVNNVCMVCNMEKPSKDYYLFGFINGADYGCEEDYAFLGDYRFTDGTLTAVFTMDSYVAVKSHDNMDWYMTNSWLGTETTSATLYQTNTGAYEKLFVPGGKLISFRLIDNGDGTFTLSYEAIDCPHSTHSSDGCCTACGVEVGHDYETEMTEATCTTAGVIINTCKLCSSSVSETIPAPGHRVESAVTSPTCSLAGYTIHTCTVCGYSYTDSPVPPKGHDHVLTEAIKPSCTTEGRNDYRCSVCGYEHSEAVTATGHAYEAIITKPTCTHEGYTTYLCACGDSYIGSTTAVTAHQYENGVCIHCGEAHSGSVVLPTLSLRYPTLSFEDEILMNVYYDASNIEDVVEMGLIVYFSQVSQCNIDNAEDVVSGYYYSESAGLYYATTNGIAAKQLGDDIYFAVYAELSDGSYVYSRLVSYSAKKYADTLLADNFNMKPLVVAMLKYGAAAQVYFNYKTDALVDADLTADQLALIEDYRADMMVAAEAPTATKQGAFVKTGGHVRRYPTVSFEGAFCINYYYIPSYAPVGDITMHYWNLDAYNAAEVLTAENATGSMKMDGSGTGEYSAVIGGIAAKYLDKAIYVAFTYSDGTTTWTSGVVGYSIGVYCTATAAGTTAMQPLAQATAVYGYYAKETFLKSLI